MTNSGSAVSATNAVNVNEYVHVIKEGQIKNYIFDVGTSSWVRDPGTVVNLSGVQITVDISGDPVRVWGLSSYKVVATVSGDWVDVSGGVITVSGNAVTVSGNAVTVSGSAVRISGDTVIAKTSGDVAQISGQAVTVSGNAVTVSGNVITLSSGTTYLASGQAVTVSGNAVTVSGNAVTVSGSAVRISGDTVIAKTSGDVAQISGQAVTVSGNWVNISGNLVTVSGNAVTVSGNAVTVSGNVIGISVGTGIIFAYVSGATTISGELASGYIFVSNSVTATAPTYYQHAEMTFASGYASQPVVMNVVFNAAQNVSTTLYSSSITAAKGSTMHVPPSPVYMLSGDIVWIAGTCTTSGDISGMTWAARVVTGN